MLDDTADLVFSALGGLGEIGMNAALYGYGPPHRRKWLMVDCGLSFAGPDLPGIDLISRTSVSSSRSGAIFSA